MGTKKIVLPRPQSESMGESIKLLLELLENWPHRKADEELHIDMMNIGFVHPFFILPLSVLVENTRDKFKDIKYKCNKKIRSYLDTIYFPEGFEFYYFKDWEQKLSEYSLKTYLPICKVPTPEKHTLIREKVLSTFEDILLQQLNLKGQMISVIKYLISEAMDNITEHSGAHYGWLMVQNYPQKGYIDVCIVDKGKGLLESYKSSDIFQNINTDYQALEYAINGKSTKYNSETRGYGINTSRKMLVNGLNGKYFLFSGNAFYIYTNKFERILGLNQTRWDGTMLALQIPHKPKSKFVYTTFLE